MAKINLNRDSNGRFKKNSTEVHVGSYEDMIKERERRLPEMIKEIEKFLENWHGGAILIVTVEHDENGDGVGHHEAILGVDKPENLLDLAKNISSTPERIIEHVVHTSNPRDLMKMALESLKDLMEGIDNDKKN